MKFPGWLKTVWWALLSGGAILYLALRFSNATSAVINPIDIVIVVVCAALLLLPLASEITIGGLTLKKEAESIKS